MTVVLNAVVAPLVRPGPRRPRAPPARRSGSPAAASSRGRAAASAGSTQVVRRPVDTLRSGPVGGVGAVHGAGRPPRPRPRRRHRRRRHVVRRRAGHRRPPPARAPTDDRPLRRRHAGRRRRVDRHRRRQHRLDRPATAAPCASVRPARAPTRDPPATAGAARRPPSPTPPSCSAIVDRLGGRARARRRRGPSGGRSSATSPDRWAWRSRRPRSGVLTVANAQMADLVRRVTVPAGPRPRPTSCSTPTAARRRSTPAATPPTSGCARWWCPRWRRCSARTAPSPPTCAPRAELDLRPVALSDAVALDGASRARRARRTGSATSSPATIRPGAHAAVVVQRFVGLRFARQIARAHDRPPPARPPTPTRRRGSTPRTASEYERLVGPGTAHADAAVELVRVAVDASLPLGCAVARPRDRRRRAGRRRRTRPAWFAGALARLPRLRRRRAGRGRRDRRPRLRRAARRRPSSSSPATGRPSARPATSLSLGRSTRRESRGGPDDVRRGTPEDHRARAAHDADLGPVRSRRRDRAVDPTTFEVLRHRLWAINDEAAVTITRVSGSPIATEGNDFNAGLTTAEGEIVVAGIYVLVHAGSLGRVVRWILDHYAENPGIRPGRHVHHERHLGRRAAPARRRSSSRRSSTATGWSRGAARSSTRPTWAGPCPAASRWARHPSTRRPSPWRVMKLVEGGVLRRDVEREYLIRSRTPELNRPRHARPDRRQPRADGTASSTCAGATAPTRWSARSTG